MEGGQGLKFRISRMPQYARRGLRTPKRSPKDAQVAARISCHNEIIPQLIAPEIPPSEVISSHPTFHCKSLLIIQLQ